MMREERDRSRTRNRSGYHEDGYRKDGYRDPGSRRSDYRAGGQRTAARRKKKNHKGLGALIGLLIVLVAVLIGGYYFMMRYYTTHFYNGTTINGVQVGGKTGRDAKFTIRSKIRSYKLTCKERNDKTESITGNEIYMEYQDDGSIDQILEGQDPRLWPVHLTGEKDYKLKITYDFDQSAIDQVMNEMDCFQPANVTPPTTATVALVDDSFQVVPGDEGTTLDRDKTREALIRAIKKGDQEIDFEAEGLYTSLNTEANLGELQQKADTFNQMLSTNVTFDFVDRQYTVDRETVESFFQKGEDGNYSLSQANVHSWVNQMALETDTYARPHEFKTTGGKVITLNEGFDDRFVPDYGWAMKVEDTTNVLMQAIQAGTQGELEPLYTFTARDRSSNDIGDTYVEVCIEQQRMWCYQDGQLVVDTPVVTGNHAEGTDTPSGGVYAIDAKQSDRNFEKSHDVHVDYWLPFVASCGIHDAYWRSDAEFNNPDTWKTNGSNGCVNTPHDAAEKIYNVMDIGYPVIVYYSEDQVKGTDPPNNVGYEEE